MAQMAEITARMAQNYETETKDLIDSLVDPNTLTVEFVGKFELALPAWQNLIDQCPDRKQELGQWLRTQKEKKFKAHWEHWEQFPLEMYERSAMEEVLT